MAQGKKSFIAYVDWKDTFDSLPDEKAGQLVKHLFAYVNDENPITNDVLINAVFANIKQQLKRDLKKYESICLRNKENGQKGGRPKQEPKKPSGLFGNPKNPDKPDNDNDNDNDNDKKKKRDIIDYSSIVENYHLYCPKLRKVSKLSEERKKHITARHKEFDLETIIKVFKAVGLSDFLNGKNDRLWKADFDWIFNPTNFLKINEGKYNNIKKEESLMMP